MSRVLVIGDLHLPAERSDYLDFCRDLRKKYKTNKVVFIGDVLDHHAISFHERHPEADAAVAEYHRSMEKLKNWKKAFPEAVVCIGNHDERVNRLAASSGIPAMYLRTYEEVFGTPNWNWAFEHVIDDVVYQHGVGCRSGVAPAFTLAKGLMCNVVCGHVHSAGGINWAVGPRENKIFGFNVPCGVDKTHILMYYSRNHIKKPVNGAGVILDGRPYMEIMD
jgi:predicted phosphodiesterase